jgi:hypothetical protein
MTEHPITPPPELVQQWEVDTTFNRGAASSWTAAFAARAAQWGADQELLACGNYLKQCAQWEEEDVTEFYNYRRPKPPSLKEQALRELGDAYDKEKIDDTTYDIIRKALKALPND